MKYGFEERVLFRLQAWTGLTLDQLYALSPFRLARMLRT